MAIRINLLPQDRQAKLKEKRNRSLIISLALAVNGGLIGIVVVLFVITQAQGLAIGRIQRDIDNKQAQIQQTENLEEMLTLQQNLKAMPGLYAQRRIVSRAMAVVERVSPSDFRITSLALDEGNRLELSGQASSYQMVTTLVRAMEADNGFSSAAVSSATDSGDGVSFSLTAIVAPGVTSTEAANGN